MKKDKGSQRILARHLALELSTEELRHICGQGTTWCGSGSTDGAGRREDWYQGDCCEGPDRTV